jgi:hypothetical protein
VVIAARPLPNLERRQGAVHGGFPLKRRQLLNQERVLGGVVPLMNSANLRQDTSRGMPLLRRSTFRSAVNDLPHIFTPSNSVLSRSVTTVAIRGFAPVTVFGMAGNLAREHPPSPFRSYDVASSFSGKGPAENSRASKRSDIGARASRGTDICS